MEKEKSVLTFKDIWYLIKKYIILELAIVVAALALGVAYTFIRQDEYMASVSVMVQAKYSDTGSSSDMNYVPYTNYYIQNVCDFLSTDIVVSTASERCGEQVSARSISTASEDNRWIIGVSYTDVTPELAREKLMAVIESAEEIAQLKDEDTGEFVYFMGSVTLPVLGAARAVPIDPTAKIMVIAFILGVILAFVAAFVLYLVNDRITGVDRVESITGMKNIQKITYIKDKKKDADGFVHMNVQKLTDTLLFLRDGERDKACMMQSGIDGEGKTTVCANLAVSLARMGKKTVVLECDFRKPNLHRMFRLEMHGGMTDYFKGEAELNDIIKHSSYEGLDVITCGERFDNPAIIFMSGKFGALMKAVREKYDFVILDCPPAGLVSDYMAIAPHTDFTVLVVGRDKISSLALRNTVSDLKACGVDLAGTVFNFAPAKKRELYYYSEKENSAGNEDCPA